MPPAPRAQMREVPGSFPRNKHRLDGRGDFGGSRSGCSQGTQSPVWTPPSSERRGGVDGGAQSSGEHPLSILGTGLGSGQWPGSVQMVTRPGPDRCGDRRGQRPSCLSWVQGRPSFQSRCWSDSQMRLPPWG